MTELELYKFIEDYNSMTRLDGETALIWVYHADIADFVKLIGNGLLEEGGFDVRLQEEYIALEMNDICEHHGIDVKNVFS